MTQPLPPCSQRAHTCKRPDRGFSLIELMVAVTIAGVLAAIAVPVFTGYLHKSRASDATKHLGFVKLQQEAYRTLMGRYGQVGGNTTPGGGTWIPALGSSAGQIPGTGGPVVWPGNTDWAQMGAQPKGGTRFAYRMAAGLPATCPVGVAPYNWPAADRDHWFISAATGDLDKDGTFMTMEINSLDPGVFTTPAKGWE